MASNDDLESKSLQELRSICRDLKINSGGTKVTLKRRITAKRTKNHENVMNMRDKIDGVGEYGTDNDDAAGDSAGGGGEDDGEDDVTFQKGDKCTTPYGLATKMSGDVQTNPHRHEDDPHRLT